MTSLCVVFPQGKKKMVGGREREKEREEWREEGRGRRGGREIGRGREREKTSSLKFFYAASTHSQLPIVRHCLPTSLPEIKFSPHGFPWTLSHSSSH